jgi:hypothetical protein
MNALGQHNADLLEFLKEHDFNLSSLARALHLQVRTVRRWNGKKRLTRVQKLALRGLLDERKDREIWTSGRSKLTAFSIGNMDSYISIRG